MTRYRTDNRVGVHSGTLDIDVSAPKLEMIIVSFLIKPTVFQNTYIMSYTNSQSMLSSFLALLRAENPTRQPYPLVYNR